ncbi:hypothetical protein ONZ45_g15268 [Pleurotus djamor]|nr:hypothetical protein ONZ45_g15268 [Pleurotus djamor]
MSASQGKIPPPSARSDHINDTELQQPKPTFWSSKLPIYLPINFHNTSHLHARVPCALSAFNPPLQFDRPQDRPLQLSPHPPSEENVMEPERFPPPNIPGLENLPWKLPLTFFHKHASTDMLKFICNQVQDQRRGIINLIQSPTESQKNLPDTCLVIFELNTIAVIAYQSCNVRFPSVPPRKLSISHIDLPREHYPTFRKLLQWPHIVRETCTVFGEDAGVSISTEASTTDLGILLKWHDELRKATRRAKICKNIILAALGLKLARECITLPDAVLGVKASEASKPTRGAAVELPPELSSWLRGEDGRSPKNVLLPLHLSLSVSPLVLLQTKSHTSKPLARHKLFMIWLLLGSDKPDSLREMEDRVWQTVVRVSNEPRQVQSILEELRSSLVSFNPASCTADETWFEKHFSLFLREVNHTPSEDTQVPGGFASPAARESVNGGAQMPPNPPTSPSATSPHAGASASPAAPESVNGRAEMPPNPPTPPSAASPAAPESVNGGAEMPPNPPTSPSAPPATPSSVRPLVSDGMDLDDQEPLRPESIPLNRGIKRSHPKSGEITPRRSNRHRADVVSSEGRGEGARTMDSPARFKRNKNPDGLKSSLRKSKGTSRKTQPTLPVKPHAMRRSKSKVIPTTKKTLKRKRSIPENQPEGESMSPATPTMPPPIPQFPKFQTTSGASVGGTL